MVSVYDGRFFIDTKALQKQAVMNENGESIYFECFSREALINLIIVEEGCTIYHDSMDFLYQCNDALNWNQQAASIGHRVLYCRVPSTYLH